MRISITRTWIVLFLSTAVVAPVSAQGTATPLTIQGLDQPFLFGARATAMGGAAVAGSSDVTALFTNPAGLANLASTEIRIGASWMRSSFRQGQDWIPNRFYPNLSLLMEDMLGGIKDPQAVDAQDMLQKPFDALKPDWDRALSKTRPSMLAIAVPVEIGGLPVVFGAGYHQVAALDHYYQNNTNLDPTLGLYRPQPIPVVTGQDSLHVRWYAYQRERTGVLNGFSASAAVQVAPSLSLGISATYYRGSSDDLEVTTERGSMTFFYDSFRLDSVGTATNVAGTSTYNGMAATIGLQYSDTYFSLGGVIRLPVTLTRDWERQATTIGAGGGTVGSTGSDKITYPVSMRFGVVLTPSAKLTLAGDISLRGTKNVEYAQNGGTPVSPWLASDLVHLGIEYRPSPWIAFRGGYHTAVEVFAPTGAGLIEEPARGSVYSVGAGLLFGMLGVDIAYEYLDVSYRDKWETNVNANTLQRHHVLLETYVRF